MRGECTPPPTAPYTVCMNEKNPLLPLLLQTFPLGFLVKIPLHCPTKSHGVQSRHFSIWLLICSVLLLSLFPLLSSVPFNFLISFCYSLCCVAQFHFYVGFLPFLCFFSMRKGRSSTLGQLIIEAWRELAEIIAHVWLCRERTRVLLLWGFLRNDVGAVPTVYSKRTAVLMQVQQGEGHLIFRCNNKLCQMSLWTEKLNLCTGCHMVCCGVEGYSLHTKSDVEEEREISGL